MLQSGRALYRQGDAAKCAYIVLGGRLRSVATTDDGTKEVCPTFVHRLTKQVFAEFGRNEVVGDTELLTEATR